ncbi:MAG: Hsp70 family protein [Desulfovermiculus sp.]|nr:Hsp70 family protein [Desulfovermiculus sp.]
MTKSIGIDLGTTNSVAAITQMQTVILTNSEGEAITPSCVTIKKGRMPFSRKKPIVGKHALEWKKQDPRNTIVAVKRLMGRGIDNPEIQELIACGALPYTLQRHSKGSENSLSLLMHGEEWTPEQISSLILQKIRSDAEEELGDEVNDAVITVPAYFNDKQKHATRTAAGLAGLRVRRLLPEPTAAAISFGVDSVGGDEARTFLVFDFGGGTFDLSVLTVSGGQFIEQGKGGDMWLGGEEIDRLVMNHVLQETAREYGLHDISSVIDKLQPSQRNLFWAELKNKVETAKIRLSTEDEANIDILGLLVDKDGDKIDIDYELDRETFDALIESVAEKTIQLTRQILQDLHFTPDMIDQVLMVGGSSRIPKILTSMQTEFGSEKVFVHERPMLAIAEGAAILSHRLSDRYECPQCGQLVDREDTTCAHCAFDLDAYTIAHSVLDIVHAAAHDYYIYLENGDKHLLIEKNTPLPCESTEVFKLVHPEQRLVHLKFVNVVNDQDESVGDLWLGIDEHAQEDDEDSPSSEVRHVEIRLYIDENNLIQIAAHLQELPHVHLSKTLSRGQADEQLLLNLEETITQANEQQMPKHIISDLQHHTLSVLQDIHGIVDEETGAVDQDLYQKAKMKIAKSWRMASEDNISRPRMYYAQAILMHYRELLSDQKANALQKKIDELEYADEHLDYDQTIEAINALKSELDQIPETIHIFSQIDNAAAICSRHFPNQEPKFLQYRQDLIEAIHNQDKEKIEEVLQKSLPDIKKVHEDYSRIDTYLYKDITI